MLKKFLLLIRDRFKNIFLKRKKNYLLEKAWNVSAENACEKQNV